MRTILIAAAVAAALSVLCGAPAALSAPGPNGQALVEQSCGSCHTLVKGQGANAGPNLFGIVGRKAGAASGFAYSADFQAALEGKIWTPQLLDRWLTDSQALAPGSGMILLIEDPAERRAIVDYLSQLH